MHAASIVVAGGKGSRMKTTIKKQYLELQGKPLLAHTLEAFQATADISQIILVVPKEDIDFCQKNIVEKYNLSKVSRIVSGGATRGESVFNGLQQTSEKDELVAVHDGARPLLNAELILRGIRGAVQYGSAIAAVKVKDTIKSADNKLFVKETIPRDELWMIQTPQVFKREILLECYLRSFEEGIVGTDDASIVEHYGYKVKVVEGDYENIKITTPEDLVLAEAILASRRRGGE